MIMRAIFAIVVATSMTAGLTASVAEAATPWVCVKDGKDVKIKGKKPKARKKKCEAMGGTWQKRDDATTEAAPAPADSAPATGGAAGW